MLLNQFIGVGDQATVVVALVSLMGASLSVAFAMAVAIHYLDKPVISLRQIISIAVIVLMGFYAIVSWPNDTPTATVQVSHHPH